MNDSLVFTLAKVVAATAWADGQITLDEINSLKDLLFLLPGLTERDWARLEMYIDSPVGQDERERLVLELKDQVRSSEDRQLVHQTLEALVQADGELSEGEREVFTEVMTEVNEARTGLFRKMNSLLRPSLDRRAEALSRAPNRERFFDDYINNRVYYELSRSLAEEHPEFKLEESELRRLGLAGGILSRVARVDRDVSPEEIDEISTAVQRGWGVSSDQADLVAGVAISEICKDLDYLRLCWNLFDVTDEPERLHLLDALFAVAAADGRVSNEETEEIRLIATSLKLSHDQFIEAKLKIPRELREI